jgi:hypothetical protein
LPVAVVEHQQVPLFGDGAQRVDRRPAEEADEEDTIA